MEFYFPILIKVLTNILNIKIILVACFFYSTSTCYLRYILNWGIYWYDFIYIFLPYFFIPRLNRLKDYFMFHDTTLNCPFLQFMNCAYCIRGCILYKRVPFFDGDNLLVFYYLSESKIWPDKRGGLCWEGQFTSKLLSQYHLKSGLIRGWPLLMGTIY